MFGYELAVIRLMLFFNAVFTAYEMGLALYRGQARYSAQRKEAKPPSIVYEKADGGSLAIVQLGCGGQGHCRATGTEGVQDSLPLICETFSFRDVFRCWLMLLIIPLTL
jgi:hypothetical protein